MTKADPVITAQIGTGFRRGNQIIGRQGILGIWHRYFDQLSAHFYQFIDRTANRRLDFRLHPGHEIFTRQADFQSLDASSQFRCVVGNRRIDRSRVASVVTADCAEDQRAVADVAGKRTDLVE